MCALPNERWVADFAQSRLARNSVTQGDFQRPVQISQFVKDLLAGFQMLNLKNDNLRRKVDGERRLQLSRKDHVPA